MPATGCVEIMAYACAELVNVHFNLGFTLEFIIVKMNVYLKGTV